MRRRYTHIALLLLLLFTLSGCIKNKQEEERKKWMVTFDHTDKRPYGTYLAFESLKYHFPGIKVQTLSTGFKYTNMDKEMKYGRHSVLILQGYTFRVSEAEWSELKTFVTNGNEVFIFCSIIDEKIEKELGCDKKLGGEEGYNYYSFIKDHHNTQALRTIYAPLKRYGYIGHSIKSFFAFPDTAIIPDKEQIATLLDSVSHDTANKPADTSYAATSLTDSASTDSTATENTDNVDHSNTYSGDITWSKPDTLGYSYDNPNFIRYTAGKGHITIHAAPLVLSNYFLLQDGNEQYLSQLWQTLPNDIDHVYWSDYYVRYTEAASSDILWRYPATKLALLIGIFALIVYILFEGKRKQRIIPIVEPLKNDSVSFVETVGRLYYNKGNHTNLAEKMALQFLEWVRTYYLLNTNQLNENFVHQLTIKSGEPEPTVRGIIDMIHEIRFKEAKVDDAYLYQLYNTIQQFYKNRRI